jgi:molybdopterin/thiamine biosynthesis adenylyltransferase
MNNRNCLTEISLPPGASPAPLADFGERLPPFIGGPEDAAQRLASVRALVAGSGSVGLEVVETLARWKVAEIAVVDPKRFKGESVLTHGIPPEAVGESKAFYAGRLAKRISPLTRVSAAERGFETIGFAELARFSVVFLATDNLLAELKVSQACLSLGTPVVQGSVHGECLCGHVRFFGHGGPEAPCVACGYTRDEWAHLNRSTLYSCEGSGANTPAEGQPTRSLSSLCSLAAQLASLQFARDLLGLGAPVRDTVLEYCAYTHQTVITKLVRKPDCPCEHQVLRRTAAPRAIRNCSLRELQEAAGLGTAVTFEVDGGLWAEQGRCECGEWGALGRFVSESDTTYGPCQLCGKATKGHPFQCHRRVPAAVTEPFRDQQLGALGAVDICWAAVRSNQHGALFLDPTP